jgi:hypothetical protein
LQNKNDDSLKPLATPYRTLNGGQTVVMQTTDTHSIRQPILNEKKQISTRNLIREKPNKEVPTAKKQNQTVQIVPLVSASTNIGKKHRANSLELVKIVKEDKNLSNKHDLGNFI